MRGMPNVQSLFGPMLFGVFFNMILYGALLVQSFTYYQSYKSFYKKEKNETWIRYFVLYLTLAETLNSAFDMHLIYEPLVQRAGTVRSITIAPFALRPDAAVTAIISVSVQLFITWRIKILSDSNLIPLCIVFFAVCSLGGAIATSVSVSLIPEFSRFHEFESAIVIWLASSAIADIIITVSLVWALRKLKTGLSHTDDLIYKIISMTIQTGAITALFAVLNFIFFLVIRDSTANFTVDFPLSKLYSNSLLSTLNARSNWAEHLSGRRMQYNVLFSSESQDMAQQWHLTHMELTPPTFTCSAARIERSSSKISDLDHISEIKNFFIKLRRGAEERV